MSTKLGGSSMPWHADMSNDLYHPFPVRTLWMYNNPNPDSGITGFLNLVDSIELLSVELKDKLNVINIIQQEREDQSVPLWKSNMNEQEFSIIKTHPISKKLSLRLNFYNTMNIKNSCISKVRINGEIQEDCSIVGQYIDYISGLNNMTYYHTWDLYDVVVMDNWNLLHNRSNLDLPDDTERLLYRVNVVHEWTE
jgi:alpha-ketoglutarate-dependent taurine dioxygenase